MQLRWRHDSENLNVVLHVLGGLLALFGIGVLWAAKCSFVL